MSGVNMFIDHDLTRYHTRTGMGVEYWRDYLKLSGNGYLRLSNWRSAPELDNDYEARPANGWDLRAEGWLPARRSWAARWSMNNIMAMKWRCLVKTSVKMILTRLPQV